MNNKRNAWILAAIVLLAAAAAAIFYFRGPAQKAPRGARLAPRDALLFAHAPDIGRTRHRWEKTALAKIANEPSVRAFLLDLGGPDSWRAIVERVARVRPRESILTVIASGEGSVEGVAAFSYDGKEADVKALVAEAGAKLEQRWPNAARDLVRHRTHEIETVTHDGSVLAVAHPKGWVLASRGLQAMRDALDRHDGLEVAGGALADAESFSAVLAELPAEHDVLVYAQPAGLADKLAQVALASGQTVDPAQIDWIRDVEAVGIACQLDGAEVRDAIFLLRPRAEAEALLERRSIALTSPNTLVYFNWRLGGISSLDLPANAALDNAGMGALRGALEQSGLEPKDFAGAFGPDAALVIDWEESSPQPSILLSLDVRDRATAARFIDAVAGGAAGPEWTRQEHGDATVRVMPQEGLSLISPTIALDGKFAIAGMTFDSVMAARARASAGESGISPAAFGKATTAGGYIDGQQLFEKAYSWLRGYLLITQMLDPKAGGGIDLAKLPPSTAVSDHLGPIVFSQTTSKKGILMESRGVVTFGQAVLGIGAGVASAMMPMIEAALAGLEPDAFLPRKPSAPGPRATPSGTAP